MKLITMGRMVRSLREIGRKRIGYIGWTGHANLGDEAMYQAARNLLAGYSVYPWHQKSRKYLMTRVLERTGGIAGGCLGGGTLIYSGYGNLGVMRAALEQGLGVFTLGCGAGTVEGVTDPSYDIPRHRSEWNAVLRECQGISVRGPLSLALLREQGFENARLVGDLALYLGKGIEPARPEGRILGVNVGVMVEEEQGRASIGALAEVIGHYQKDGWGVRIYCIYPKDRGACEALAGAAGLGTEVIEEHAVDEGAYLRSVRECRVLVGMKLHAVVLACCGRVPSVMLEYRPKCRDFMLSMGLERYNRKLEELDKAWLVEAIDDLMGCEEEVVEQIDSRIKGYVEAMEAYAGEMGACLERVR